MLSGPSDPLFDHVQLGFGCTVVATGCAVSVGLGFKFWWLGGIMTFRVSGCLRLNLFRIIHGVYSLEVYGFVECFEVLTHAGKTEHA